MARDLATRFPHFKHRTRRTPEQTVSAFFFVLTAAQNFQHHQQLYGLDLVSNRVKELIEKILRVAELICFRPSEPDQPEYSLSSKIIGRRDNGDEPDEIQENNDDWSPDVGNDIDLSDREVEEILKKMDDPSLKASERMLFGNLLLFPTTYKSDSFILWSLS